MFLPALHLPLLSAGYFGGVIARMLDFVALRVRRSDQGMSPSLSPGLRTQTVALHRRLTTLSGEFHRLIRLAQKGRLRVHPDRASPAARSETTAVASPVAAYPRPEPASPFGPAPNVVHGAMLPPLSTRGFGWMLGFVPASYRDALAGSLQNPEVVALIGASPTAARLLRSFCNGLGIARPKGVFPAPRRRAPRVEDAGAAGPGSASRSRAPRDVMSARARDRWWAERREAACSAVGATGAGESLDAAMPGRCAKR